MTPKTKIERLELKFETVLFQKTADNINAISDKINELVDAFNSLSHSTGEYNPFDLGTPLAPGHTTSANTTNDYGKANAVDKEVDNPEHCARCNNRLRQNHLTLHTGGKSYCLECAERYHIVHMDKMVSPSPREEWEERFDRKFEGYWKGNAIPDEIKFFIRFLLQEERARLREEIEKMEGQCSCGNSTGSPLSKRVNIKKSDVLSLLNNNTEK